MKDWPNATLIASLEKARIAIEMAFSPQEKDRFERFRDELQTELDARRRDAGRPPETTIQQRARSFRREVDGYVGLRVRAGRAMANVSQAQLGDAVGLRQSELSRVETGRRSLTVCELLRIAIELGQLPDFFLEMRHTGVVKTGWEPQRERRAVHSASSRPGDRGSVTSRIEESRDSVGQRGG